jgi:hypothetical protein
VSPQPHFLYPGWITHSYSWRVVHVILGFLGLIVFTTVYVFFPETMQPGETGIDKMKATNGIDSSTPSFTFINPFKSMWLLRSPAMLLIVRFYTFKSRDSLITIKGFIISASQLSFLGEGSSSNVGNMPLLIISNCPVSAVPLPYTLVRQPRFFTSVMVEVYNLLKGQTLSHNQRGIDWCLLFTCRYRKHEFVFL